MQIHTLPLGSYQTNCYILHKEADARCLVIDPGDEAEKLLAFLRLHRLHPEAILLTHGHFDHVGAVAAVAAETDCQVYLCPEERKLPPMMTGGPLIFTDHYGDGQKLTLAGLSFQVLHTPGHTPGSVCLLFDRDLFSGDTLFAGSCGRTDFPGSDPAAMRRSLKLLRELPGDYRVYPGHAEDTTLSAERQQNPYL